MKRQRDQALADKDAAPQSASAEPRSATFAWPSLLIFATAAFVRLVHVWQIRRAPFFTMLMGDARGYDAWAQRIAGGEWIGTEVFYQAPLYPYVLGIIYSVAGRDLLVVRLVQALLGAAACALLGAAAARLFSRRAGLLAGLGLALYAPALFFDGLVQKAVLDVFFVCLALWLMSRIIGRHDAPLDAATRSAAASPANWLWLGLTMGALALTRENAIVLVAITLLWIAFGGQALRATPDRATAQARSKPPPRARSLGNSATAARLPGARLGAAGMFVLGLAVVLLPVAIRNYAVGGGFYLTTAQFGPNFFIGNNPRSDGTYSSLRFGRGAPEYERQDATELAEHALGRTLTPSEVSGYWTDRATGFITSQPGAWLRLMGRKFFLLWNADEMLDTESQDTYAEWSLPLRLGAPLGHFGVLVPLAVLGMWTLWPDRRRLWVLYVMTFGYAASVIVFYVFARYRFPLVPFLMLFAAAGVATTAVIAGDGARSRRADGRAFRAPAPIWTAAAVLMATVVFTNWPVLSRSLMRAITENNLAVAFQEAGRLDDAVSHYRRSVALEPDYAPAHNNMGAALRAQGQLDAAIASYERALAAQPDYPDAHYNLANALLDNNQPQEAAAHFRQALIAIPGSAGARNNLGIALANEGRLEEAVAEFRAVLRLEPDSARTNRNLGKTLSSMGRGQEALTFLRRAVELDPKDPEAHYDLGGELLESNMLAEAARAFEAVLALDPLRVEARNNLGITLASMGRLDEAIDQFQQALKIRPGFADAARNLALAQAQKKR